MSENVRTIILDNLATRMEAKFSREKGTVRQLFRQIKRGPWEPGNVTRPACTIVDYGAKRGEKNNSDTTKGRVLAIQFVLDIEANWTREKDCQDWTDNVAQIINNIQNYKAGPGLLRLDFETDNPFEVILADGASEQIWIIEFEAEFFEDYAAFG